MSTLREVRLGLVLYGGTSLAIYIHGVTQELLRLVRATAVMEGSAGKARIPFGALGSVEKVYRKLAQLSGSSNKSYSDVADEDPICTRVVLDVIAGTSAGGINGVYLGKALAGGGSLDSIKNLWIEKGDIDQLLNDKDSVREYRGLAVQHPPQSVLNSQTMYLRLLNALGAMKQNGGPLTDELDVYITATDLDGLVVKVPVGKADVYERCHRSVFRFSLNSCGRFGRNDFEDKYNPQLAFAARCTSSFPLAFEPMVQTDAEQLVGYNGQDSAPEEWDMLFAESEAMKAPGGMSQTPHRLRAYADGGYLDNKPFSYAVDRMLERLSEAPVERKLIYVEPSPEDFETASVPGRPDAAENVWLALSALPRKETIREDIQRVVKRNAEVRRLRELRDFVFSSVPTRAADGQGKQFTPKFSAEEWKAETAVELAQDYGAAYISYHRLKVSVVTDMLADGLCYLLQIPKESVEAQKYREAIRTWRTARYETTKDCLTEFLLEFDLPYRLRRLRRLAEVTDEILGSPEAVPNVRESLQKFRQRVRTHFRKLRALLPSRDFYRNFSDIELACVRDFRDNPRQNPNELICLVTCRLQTEFACTFTAIRKDLDKLLEQLNSNLEPKIGGVLKNSFENYEEHDLVLLPLLHDSAIKELSEVEIVRISPVEPKGPVFQDGQPVVDERTAREEGKGPWDAGNPRKLKGASLGNFGGFLDREWRRNDILWGRLDAAELLIRNLLGTSPDAEKAVREAHRGILMEELHDELQNDQNAAGIGEPTYEECVKKFREFRERLLTAPDRETSAVRIGRAAQILSLMADDLADRKRFSKLPASLLGYAARFGMGVTALVSQRSLIAVFTNHWLRLLYLLVAVLVVLGLGYAPAAQVGWLLLAVTVGVHLGIGFFRDFLIRSSMTRTYLAGVLGMGLFALAILGIRPALSLLESGRSQSSALAILLVIPVAAAALAIIRIQMLCKRVGVSFPMLRLEEVNSAGAVGIEEQVFKIAGDLGDEKRTRLRRALEWDAILVAGYGSVFLLLAAIMADGRQWNLPPDFPAWLATWLPPSAAVLTALTAAAAVLSDIAENVRLDVLLARSRREASSRRSGSEGRFSSPAPFAQSKWICVFLAVALIGSWAVWRLSTQYPLYLSVPIRFFPFGAGVIAALGLSGYAGKLKFWLLSFAMLLMLLFLAGFIFALFCDALELALAA